MNLNEVHFMKCIICQTESSKIFNAEILYKYNIDYYQCKHCGLIFTEKPYWLGEAYSDAIADIDTGIMQRNIEFVNKMSVILQAFFSANETFLDYGGGYGIFTRMMRDKGFNYLWTDKYASPLLAKGFEYQNETVSALTAFELFEHFENPKEEIEKMLSLTKNIFFSTACYDDGMNIPDKDWWYWSYESGQHISFYSKRTLEFLAGRYQLHYYNILGLHWLTDKTVKDKDLAGIERIYNKSNKNTVNYEYCVKDMKLLKDKI